MHGDRPLRLATRGSAQARTQARAVADALMAADPGRRRRAGLRRDARRSHAARDVPLHTIGGQGVFVKEVQQRRARAATPTSPCTRPRTCRRRPPTGCSIAAFCARRDAARRAGRVDARRAGRRARRSPPARCAGAPSSTVGAARPRSSSSCAATSTPASARCPTAARS